MSLIDNVHSDIARLRGFFGRIAVAAGGREVRRGEEYNRKMQQIDINSKIRTLKACNRTIYCTRWFTTNYMIVRNSALSNAKKPKEPTSFCNYQKSEKRVSFSLNDFPRQVHLLDSSSCARARWPLPSLKRWFAPRAGETAARRKEDRDRVVVVITNK